MTTIVFTTPYGQFSLAERTNPALGNKALSQHIQERKPITALDTAKALEDYFHTKPSASDDVTDQVIIRFLHMDAQAPVSCDVVNS